jgi:hypothetical protein
VGVAAEQDCRTALDEGKRVGWSTTYSSWVERRTQESGRSR